MTRFRWAWAAMAVAATATGGEPVPQGGPGAVPVEVLPEVVLPAADGFHPRRWNPPPPVCEPPTRPGAMPPGTTPPGTTPPGTMPPTTDPTRPPGDTDPGTSAPEAGGLSAASLNPNMFGDQFSGSAKGILSRRFSLIVEPRAGGSTFARYQGNVNTVRYSPHQDFPQDFPARVTVEGRQLFLGSPDFQAFSRISPNPGVQSVNVLRENPAVSAVLKTLVPQGGVQYVTGSATEVDDGSLLTPHRISLTYDISQTGLALALPPDGGIVGRTKLSDDNNPLPRDRVILNYDYYANPVLAAGLDVHRTAVGLETTFFDRQASFEFRIPFASTLDNVSGAGGVSARDIEFGNLFTAVKGLFIQGQEFNASAGFAVSFPTANDAVLLAFDGRELVRVKNESILVAPFLAALYTPGDRFFAQAWVQGSFDLIGNSVLTDFNSSGAVETGRLRDQARILTDLQIGYWVYRRSSGEGLRGLAPFFELHYNTTISDASQVQGSSSTVIGLTNKRFDEVNASVGLTALFGSNMMVMARPCCPPA